MLKIKIFMVKLILPIFFIISLDVIGDTQSCLDERWIKTEPTEQEKEFDVLNDFDRDGNHYSCNAYTTPTKINNFLKQLKTEINDNDYESLSAMMKYPLNISTPGYTLTDKGYRKGNSLKITRKEDFIEKFSAEIYTLELTKVIGCVTLTNIVSLPGQNISIAPGIWIYVNPDTYKLSISGLSTDQKALAKWLERNKCEVLPCADEEKGTVN